MISLIYVFIILLSLLFGIINGQMNEINDAILESPLKSFEMIVSIGCSLVFWSGILEIALKSGLLEKLTFFLRIILKPLFKNESKEALTFIASNVASNILGLGSASIPLGLEAMKELNKNNLNKEKATKSMITFIILNTSGLTLIPSTILTLRKAKGAMINYELVPIIMISSIITALLAISIDFIIRRFIK